MTDVLASRGLSANSDRSQTIQKPIKTLTTSVVNDDEKYESADDKVEVQVSKPKSLTDSSLPADDSKDTEVESGTEYGLEPATEQEEDASASASQQKTKQDDSIDYVADVYPSFYSQEMELALANVRKLASIHQEELANSFCDTFARYNGREPSLNDLSAIFGRIEVQLAEEAADEWSELDDSPYDDEEGDSDFDEYNVSDRVQVQKDLAEDYVPAYDSMEGELESEFSDDGDYDPKNFEDLHQGQKDLEEDIFDSDEPLLIDDTFKEEVDEEDIIDGINFDTQYFEAMERAKLAGKNDAYKIVSSIQKEYSEVYGEEVVEDILSKSFAHLASYELDEEEEESEDDDDKENINPEEEVEDEESKASELVSESEEEEYVDPDTFASEMELALANVRKLATYQQEEFVTKISDLYSLYNGSEPSASDLADVFSGIKQEFADEAAEEILSELDEDIEQAEKKEDGDDSDSDYDPKDEADLKQVEADEEEDYSSEEDVDENAVIS